MQRKDSPGLSMLRESNHVNGTVLHLTVCERETLHGRVSVGKGTDMNFPAHEQKNLLLPDNQLFCVMLKIPLFLQSL